MEGLRTCLSEAIRPPDLACATFFGRLREVVKRLRFGLPDGKRRLIGEPRGAAYDPLDSAAGRTLLLLFEPNRNLRTWDFETLDPSDILTLLSRLLEDDLLDTGVVAADLSWPGWERLRVRLGLPAVFTGLVAGVARVPAFLEGLRT